MILIIDNYDSFTYNLVQYIGEEGYTISVYKSDKVTKNVVLNLKPQKIIISPGPGRPEEFPNTLQIISYFGQYIPILGVCLGHQGIGYIHNAKITV